MAPSANVVNAFKAMSNLGISDQLVQVVLRKLLKVYDGNWELIEAENYRALADAIFEYEEAEDRDLFAKNKDKSPSKKSQWEERDDKDSSSMKNAGARLAAIQGPSSIKGLVESSQHCFRSKTLSHSSYNAKPRDKGERPIRESQKDRNLMIKRVQGGVHIEERRDEFVSPIRESIPFGKSNGSKSEQFGSMNNARAKLASEDNAIQEPSSGKGLVESSQHCFRSKTQSRSFSYDAKPRDKGKRPIREPQKDQNLMNKRVRGGVHIEEPRDDFVSPIRESITFGKSLENLPQNAIINPKGYSASQIVDMDKKADVSTSCNYGRHSEANLDVVSSLSGEVKILVNCKSAFQRPDFLVPPIDAVLKLVEDKYLHSYDVVGKEFSLMKLLEEVCETFLEMGTNFHGSTSRKQCSEDCSDCAPRNIRVKKEEPFSGDSGKNSDKKNSGCPKCSTIQSLATAPHLPVAPTRKRHFHDISDISKGTERVKISLVDDVGCDALPKFNYISQNVPYQNAYVHASLARVDDENCCSDCSSNCLELSLPCACARDTGGEFAYTPQGLLKAQFLYACLSMNENPQKHHYFYCEDCPIERNKNEKMPESCKGHLMKKFIKECWIKCGCNLQCGNRVVQRGISRKLQVFYTPEGKGWGVRSLQALPRGAFVCEYVGEIMTNTELYYRNLRTAGEQHTYPVMLDADWGSEGFLQDEEALCLDATYNGNVARFINHRCFDANLIDIPVEVETPDRHYYHVWSSLYSILLFPQVNMLPLSANKNDFRRLAIEELRYVPFMQLAFFTKREVKALEELTWDYSIDFEDRNHPVKAFKCCCGSANCRDPKRKGTKPSVRPRR